MMNQTKSVLIVGVGGQGTLLASKMFTWGLMQQGYDVKMSEIHGMSQRGGSVSAHIRYGDRVYSPVIGLGEADVLVSFEEMETYRWLQYLKTGGVVIMNQYQLPSAPILGGKATYPQGLTNEIQMKVDTVTVDAQAIVGQLNAPRAMNMVMLGALVQCAGLVEVDWHQALENMVRPQYVDSNYQALLQGMQQVKTGEADQ